MVTAILVLTIAATLISSSILSWYYVLNKVKLDRDKFELDKFDLHINTDIKITQLDAFIASIIDEYFIANVQPNVYINKIETENIMRACVKLIDERMSDTLRDQLSVFYNKADINKIVVTKVYAYITRIAEIQNAPKVKVGR